MFRKLFITILSFAALAYGTPHNSQVGSLSYEWDNTPDFYKCKQVFVSAFTKCYDSIPIEVLNQPSRPMVTEWLENTFDEFYTTFVTQDSTLRWLVAKEGDQVAGFLLIDLEKFPEEIYLAQMAVDPSYQRQGIATNLVTSLLEQFPEAKRLVVITRIANEEAKSLYETLDFANSSYMHEGYSEDLFTGFEYNLKG